MDAVVAWNGRLPIPATARRSDLGLIDRLVDVRDILRILLRYAYFERVTFAPELGTHHPQLYQDVQQIFTGSGADFAAYRRTPFPKNAS